jgi:hypothetical protein
MKLPRDLSGQSLVRHLSKYAVPLDLDRTVGHRSPSNKCESNGAGAPWGTVYASCQPAWAPAQ